MHCKFPYFEDRPHIPIILENNGIKARFLPLLDTGADFSIFYKSDAIRIGLDWSKGKKLTLQNADGSEFIAKEYNLKIIIENYSFNANVCFVDNKYSAMPLLGRKNIFEKFKITIVEKESFIELTSIE